MSGTGEGGGAVELFHSYTSRVSKYISSGVLPISICNSFAILMKAFLISPRVVQHAIAVSFYST